MQLPTCRSGDPRLARPAGPNKPRWPSSHPQATACSSAPPALGRRTCGRGCGRGWGGWPASRACGGRRRGLEASRARTSGGRPLPGDRALLGRRASRRLLPRLHGRAGLGAALGRLLPLLLLRLGGGSRRGVGRGSSGSGLLRRGSFQVPLLLQRGRLRRPGRGRRRGGGSGRSAPLLLLDADELCGRRQLRREAGEAGDRRGGELAARDGGLLVRGLDGGRGQPKCNCRGERGQHEAREHPHCHQYSPTKLLMKCSREIVREIEMR